MAGDWKAIETPTNPDNDSFNPKPIFEGKGSDTLDHFKDWKRGSDTTPFKKAKGIVITDELGRIRYTSSRS